MTGGIEALVPAVVEATRCFGLGEPVEVPMLAARGAMGEVYRVTTPAGPHAIKRLFEWNDGSAAEREAAFTARARDAGVITPVEVRAPTESLIVTVGNERFRAFSWLDLDPPLRPPLPVGVLVDVGRLVARLHEQGGPSTDGVDDWYLVPPAKSAWDSLARQAEASPSAWAAALVRRLPELHELSDCVADAPRLPAWTCHRDLDLTNVLPVTSGGLAVLDWENVGPLAKQHELAYVAFEWSAPADDELETRVRILRDAYADAGGACGTFDLHSFTVTWVTLLNFLVAQAESVLDVNAEVRHREFGERAVQNILGMGLSVTVANRIIAAWNN